MTSRRLILVVTMLFIAGLTALTILDLVHYGVNALSVVWFVILLFFWVMGERCSPPMADE